MAKCKVCKKSIPDGTDYCKDCQDQGIAKAKESYLDSLLNSVKNGPSMENIYKRKNHSNDGNNSPGSILHQNSEPEGNLIPEEYREREDIQLPEIDDDEWYRVDFSDMDEFDQLSYEEDLQDLESEISISDEDLFGESLSDLFSQSRQEDRPLAVMPGTVQAAQVAYVDKPMDSPASNVQEEPAKVDMNIELPDTSRDQQTQPLEEAQTADEDPDSDIDMDLDDLLNQLNVQNIESPAEEEHEPLQEVSSSYLSDDINEMMLSLGDDSESREDETEQQKAVPLQDEWQEELQEEEQDDFLSLLNQMSEEDPVMEDVRAIHDLLGNMSSGTRREDSMPGDVGEVFSDALKAVSSLSDYELEEDSILEGIQDRTSPKKGKNKKPKKEKKAGKEKAKKTKKTKAVKEKSGLTLFQRIFGNVKDAKTAAEHEKELFGASEPKAKSPKKPKLRGKKGGASQDEENIDLEDNIEGKGKPAKKESKKEKAEKKIKSKDVIQVIDEIDEDPGRINRVGAAVVLFFFAIIAVIVILGTNVITYTLSIEYATGYFNNRKYTQAYNEVYGVEIKDEDIEIYDKIMTVMFVNKQLNSYNNYYSMEKYPEALDSLLKGLSRYDKYIELATMLGIESDLDYVRSQILAELYNVFNLTEKEAVQILQYDSMTDYSLAVYDVVLEKMNN